MSWPSQSPGLGAARSRLCRVLTMAIVVAVGGTLACACGGNSESGGDRGAQPAPGVTAFLSGQLDDVPTLGRMNALGPERVVNRVATQTFRVLGETPKDSIHIYRDVLERSGWTRLRAPYRTGTRRVARGMDASGAGTPRFLHQRAHGVFGR